MTNIASHLNVEYQHRVIKKIAKLPFSLNTIFSPNRKLIAFEGAIIAFRGKGRKLEVTIYRGCRRHITQFDVPAYDLLFIRNGP